MGGNGRKGAQWVGWEKMGWVEREGVGGFGEGGIHTVSIFSVEGVRQTFEEHSCLYPFLSLTRFLVRLDSPSFEITGMTK